MSVRDTFDPRLDEKRREERPRKGKKERREREKGDGKRERERYARQDYDGYYGG